MKKHECLLDNYKTNCMIVLDMNIYIYLWYGNYHLSSYRYEIIKWFFSFFPLKESSFRESLITPFKLPLWKINVRSLIFPYRVHLWNADACETVKLDIMIYLPLIKTFTLSISIKFLSILLFPFFLHLIRLVASACKIWPN